MTDEDGKPIDWKRELVRWAAQQGVSTVLLIALVAGLFYYAPRIMADVHEKYKEHQAGFRVILTEQRQDFLEALREKR